MRHSVLVYFIIFFIGVSLIGGSVFTTYSQFVEEGPLTEQTEVVVPRGNLQKVTQVLTEAGVISSPSIFELGVRASGNAYKLKAGEYSFPPRASAKMVMNIMADGQTYIRRVAIPEGLTSTQIVEILNSAKGLAGLISKVPDNGTLLPDTYHYSYGDTKESMLVRMENAMTRLIEEEWPKRANGLPFKKPIHAIVLASVVEKETGIAAERPRIAGVFVNRLNKKMKLQSDPTVIYAVTDGELNLGRNLTYKDLKIGHPYNTYVVPGLPAGPIGNPGRAAIMAVLNPEHTGDLYFVADGTGGHVFSPTYKGHQQNVTAWRKVQKKKSEPKTPAVVEKIVPTAPIEGQVAPANTLAPKPALIPAP